MDAARGQLSRSQFFRAALLEKLRALGFDVTEVEASAPDRKGKGGPKRRTRVEQIENTRSAQSTNSIVRVQDQATEARKQLYSPRAPRKRKP